MADTGVRRSIIAAGLAVWSVMTALTGAGRNFFEILLARIGVADGDPVNGYLASGTVAGVINDRPTCDELVQSIVEEAEQTLKRLAP